MKKKIILVILCFIILLFPIKISALSNEYKDVVAPIINQETIKNKINLYLFYGSGCPHCKEEENFLSSIKEKYDDKVNFIYLEVWDSKINSDYLTKVKEYFSCTQLGVPFTVIGEHYFIGYTSGVDVKITKVLDDYLSNNSINNNPKTFNIPFLGEVSAKNVSLPIIAIILGLVDGFNPCAMWVLLFLINMLLGMKNKKKMFVLGFVFLLTSGFVYFLSMLGINIILGISMVKWVRIIIAIVALIVGILNIRNYLLTRKDTGCHVVNNKKRKIIFEKIKKFTHEKNFILALLGIIVLSISVNLVELACSLGFPAVFAEILALNNVTGITRIIYLLLYTLLYMIDDIIVFIIAMVTLQLTGVSTKYTKYTNLICGIIMIIMGILLIFKPAWIMFNF